MLNLETIKKIEDLVADKPRSINEIASIIRKNWRTADRYIEYIKENFGTISTRIFREGTRGALKIVYWSSLESRKSSIFQSKLQEQIEIFKRKEDFSAFDIYQHIHNDNKRVSIEKQEEESKTNLRELTALLEQTKKQLLIFSGNLSWINLKNKDASLYSTLDSLVKKGISIKILSRVDLASIENIEKILSLNFKHGKDIIEIRHREQPLRGFIFDNNMARLKEIKEPTGKIRELNQRVFIFYTIKDKDWVEWMSKSFWNLFAKSIDSRKRIEEMKNFI